MQRSLEPATRVPVASAVEDEFVEEVREFMAAAQEKSTTAKPLVIEVEQALDTIRRDEKATKRRERQERAAAKQEATLAKLSVELGLNNG